MEIGPKQINAMSKIYDVVLDNSKWTETLDELSHEVGSIGASLFVTDHTIGELSSAQVSSSLMPHVADFLSHDFADLETKAILEFPRVVSKQGLVRVSEIIDNLNKLSNLEFDLSESEGWQRETFGLYHRLTSPLSFYPAYYDVATFHFGNLSREELDDRAYYGNFFLPHIQKAIELSRPFQLLQSRFKAVLGVLDRLHLGIFILNSDGLVVVSNQAADRVLDLNDGLRLSQNKKLIANGADDYLLQQAISDTSFFREGLGSSEVKRIDVSRKDGGTPYIVETSLISHRDIELSGVFQGLLVIVIDPDYTPIIDTSGLEMLFRFTQAEREVCKLLIQGESTNAIADQRNSKPETVRGQIKALLQKTNTKQRADLVRLALSINLPVDAP